LTLKRRSRSLSLSHANIHIGRYLELILGNKARIDKNDEVGKPSNINIKPQKRFIMSNIALGIDIAKSTYHAYIEIDQKEFSRKFRNRPDDFPKLLNWLEQIQTDQIHVCMEATNRYWENLAQFLFDAGMLVSVVNPTRIHNYAKCKLTRNKTDSLDAALIADYCATLNPPLWTPPAPQIRELQAMLRHLDTLKQTRTQEYNRHLLENPSQSVDDLISQHLNFLDQQIEQLVNDIHQHIDRHDDLRTNLDLLVSIPGIAFLTAAKLLGENIQRFRSARALTAYAGLNPSISTSGSSVRHKS